MTKDAKPEAYVWRDPRHNHCYMEVEGVGRYDIHGDTWEEMLADARSLADDYGYEITMVCYDPDA